MALMYPLKRLMVCLDESELDNKLIEYSNWLADKLGSETVYFVHVSKKFEYPDSFKDKYPDMVVPQDEMIKKGIEENVHSRFTQDIKVQIEVREGNFTETIVRFIELKQIDLVVVGKRDNMGSSGYNARRIGNLSRCSVLFVPERAQPKADRIFVPINFSELSTMSMELALQIREHSEIPVRLQHIYKVPNGFRYSGKTYEEFARLMKSHSEDEYSKYMNTSDFNEKDFEIQFQLGEVGKTADGIFKSAVRSKSDLMILGSRGRTSVASFILGSNAVGLIRPDNTIPYIIVKQKTDNLDFFQAIKEF